MPNAKKPKRVVGGSAAERGLDFQARVSAIVMANLVAERPIGWLEGFSNDTPLELDAETGGPGDDVRFLAHGGKRIELQAKRGLQRGDDLWEALLSLANGIASDHIDAGILAICPNSSGSIKETLSEDIIRLGSGRSDGLREIGVDFSARLVSASLDVSLVCSRLRIVVVSAVDGNREAEATASERLGRVVEDPQTAWRALVEYGRRLIRIRGKGSPEQIYRELSLAGVSLRMSAIETRIQLQAAIKKWLHETYSHITILGVSGLVSFADSWLSLDAYVTEVGPVANEELDKALNKYHEYSYRHRSHAQAFDSHTIGRFINRCVVLGGPGIGKSTLLKKLALTYSDDGLLVLLVKLPQVAALVARDGRRFEDCVIESALSGSGVRGSPVSLDGAVLLCDALDECGNQQSIVTAALHAFSVAHPNTRIVVSSRPIGYRPGELANWRHYELQPLEDTKAEEAISKVLHAIPFPNEQLRDQAVTLAKEQLRARSIKGAASRNPLMLTLMAALSAKGIDPGSGKAALYRQLFQLIEDHPPARLVEPPPSEPERRRFLELLGWALLAYGNEPADQTLKRCAKSWSEEFGLTPLASELKVCVCCNYWECLGVVERVRTLTQEAITFVHKTFGEFAAARYISQCEVEEQRTLVTRAIQTPAWKEALSFASHLGLASLILEVWAELAAIGNTQAGYGLDEAMELVVQSGIPISERTLKDFTACCWRVLSNTASRTRYAAGDALCLVSKDHWEVVRQEVLERLEAPDNWSKIVAWACLSISPEPEIPFQRLTAVLQSLNELMPRDSYFKGLSLAPSGRAVRQHLTVGATRKILQRGPEPDGLKVLNDLLADAGSMSIYTIADLNSLFDEFGIDRPPALSGIWAKSREWLFPPREDWVQMDVYLLDVIDNPLLNVEGEMVSGQAHCWELGAFLTATHFWEMPISECLNLPSGDGSLPLRRKTMQRVAEAVGLDLRRLVMQARYCRERIRSQELSEWTTIFDLPRVDIDPQYEAVPVDVQEIGDLEQIILGDGMYFAMGACLLLYGLREAPEYAETVERLLTKGRGDSLRIATALSDCLPRETGQRLLLNRLCDGMITFGCQYLYEGLKPPFDDRHIHAVRRGLEGKSAQIAKAAATLALQLPLTGEFTHQLRDYFDQWMAKEDPYPEKDGVVPDSPRDKLAPLLTAAFADEHDFLIRLAKDNRPNVRTAARESIVKAAATAPSLRKRVIQETELNALEPALLRAMLTEDLYMRTEAPEVALLLLSGTAKVRYAALPILDTTYLPIEVIRAEGNRLLSDGDMDIREAASQVLKKLGETKSL